MRWQTVKITIQMSKTMIASTHHPLKVKASIIIISSEMKSGEGGNAKTAIIPSRSPIAPTLLILI